MKTDLIKFKKKLHQCIEFCKPAAKLEMAQDIKFGENDIETMLEKGCNITINQYQAMNFHVVKNINRMVQDVDKMIMTIESNGIQLNTFDFSYESMRPALIQYLSDGGDYKSFIKEMKSHIVRAAREITSSDTAAAHTLGVVRGTLKRV
jgi:hypothetical protein